MYHNLEFIGDGLWECMDCKQTQTNNISLVNYEYLKKFINNLIK